jgi:hypothetical protein
MLSHRNSLGAMPRSYLVFGDIEGKLDVLHVECTKCGRGGHYGVARLIEKHGREGSLMKWKAQLNADCPRRDAQIHDRCDLACPDLSKTL